MNDDFRSKVLMPILVPLGMIAYFVGAAFAIAQLLLAMPSSTVATVIVIAVAVLAVGGTAWVATRPNISGQVLAMSLSTGVVVILLAGTVGAVAGPRESVAPEAAAPTNGDDAVFVAVDSDYSQAPESLPAGDVEITLENEGSLHHDVTFEELGETVVEAGGGDTESGTATFESGSYYFYCSRADHEDRGMFGELEVTG